MSEPAIITIAREYYDNIFDRDKGAIIEVDLSGNIPEIDNIYNMKRRLKFDFINNPAIKLSESEINFIRGMHMGGPQLVDAIKIFDIINRYCHPDDCLEEQNKVETLLKKYCSSSVMKIFI